MFKIYLIENTTNGKLYVGQTRGSIIKRWCDHKYDARRGADYPLHRAIRKYGKNNFDVRGIDFVETQELANEREIFWIDFFNSHASEIGYNATMGGGGSVPTPENLDKAISRAKTLHTYRTKDTFKKVSLSLMGNKRSKESRQKQSESVSGSRNHFYGKKHSLETREKIVSGNKSRVVSNETRNKLSKQRSGKNNRFYGKVHSEETRKRMSESKQKLFLDRFLKTVAWG